MAKVAVTGAMMQCTFGVAPASLIVPMPNFTATKLPMGTIQNFAPGANIPPFGMCQSLSNPTVAAATSAALGVLTPMPCVPATASPWAPGAIKTKVGKIPALTATCKLTCSYGGVISITNPGQFQVDAK